MPASTVSSAAPSTALADADLSLAVLFASRAMTDEIERRLADDGFDDLRISDRPLFQHLLDGPLMIGALAGRLGITQQATSKAVADLEDRGYVVRQEHTTDGRSRLAALTPKGRRVIEADGRHRADLEHELRQRLGSRRIGPVRGTLLAVVDALGVERPNRGRRFRPLE